MTLVTILTNLLGFYILVVTTRKIYKQHHAYKHIFVNKNSDPYIKYVKRVKLPGQW